MLGAAVGPALGGVLTQVFDWRAIFIAQVPLAAAAIAATVPGPGGRARGADAGGRDAARPARWISGAALALISAALVGALFLAVVLMIDGWGHEPLLAAAIVSALPAGALAAAPIAAPQRHPGRGRPAASCSCPAACSRWRCCRSPAWRCSARRWASAAWGSG